MHKQSNSRGKDQAGEIIKYLTCSVGSEEYGIEVLKVREIIGLLPITKIPKTPDFIRGVINLRGQVIPVVDTRVKFGMESKENTEETCIIVVDVTKGDDSIEMGLLVDKVAEVLDIHTADIEPAKSLGAVRTDFINGIAKIGNGIKILLNIDRLLTSDEVGSISSEMFTPESAPVVEEQPLAKAS